ncbi:MAG: [Fe-S]-binding protein [Deltaproteobacteria bacterium]|nr:[Fe-S]-binding protein [Deltaproteobacteria bacterium]
MSLLDKDKYWQCADEHVNEDEHDHVHGYDHERDNPPPASVNRRSFFKIMGLSTAAVAAAGCKRAPVAKIVPYLTKPEEVTPGEALWYASTCGACSAACGILLKTRDGRPIKVEGNEKHPASRGGVCAMGQASVLSLYDAARARGPLAAGKATTWAELDAAVKAGFARAAASGKSIRVVTPPVVGPTADATIAAFLAAFPTAKRVTFDALPYEEAIADAHAATHGARVVPAYNFGGAKVVVSVGADFLGTWVSPVAFTRDYAKARDPEGVRPMLRHIQIESTMSLAGANADRRYSVAPSDEIPVLAALARRVLERSDVAGKDTLLAAVAKIGPAKFDARSLDAVAKEILARRTEALVVSGSTDVRAQTLVNIINYALGTTVVSSARPLHRLAAALSFAEFLAELKAGSVGAVLLCGVNPVYAHPDGAEIAKALRGIPLVVSTNDRVDETASAAAYLAPSHHFLESWGDAATALTALSLSQPAVTPLFDTRGTWESLLAWAGRSSAYYDFMRARWEKEVFPVAADAGASFQAFWDRSVHDGVAALKEAPEAALPFRIDETQKALEGIGASPAVGGVEVALYAKVGMRDGALANNGWLQELPDPISKATWGNYAAMSPALAKKQGLAEGAGVTVSFGDRKVTLPVLIQQGTHENVVALALGYGRTRAGKVGNGVGANAFALARVDAGRVQLCRPGAAISATGAVEPLALTQTHHSQEKRALVREATARPASCRVTPRTTSRPSARTRSGAAARCTGFASTVILKDRPKTRASFSNR